MAEQTRDTAGNGNGLYFIVGGLAVPVAVVAYLFWGGHIGGGTRNVDIKIETPAATPAPPAPTLPVPPVTPPAPKN